MKTLYGQQVQLHSQPATGQDEWVIEATGGLQNGYFVECGVNDGLRHSNTLALEQSFGWRGLLVEAVPELHEQAKQNRPNCEHACVALSITDVGIVKFSKAGQWGGLLSFLPEAWQQEHRFRQTPVIWVKTRTLRSLLAAHNAPKIIDYLSLDIEGAEYPVLDEFYHYGYPTHRIRCLTVEYREEASELMRLRRLLEPHGYILVRTQAWDAFFQHQSLMSESA